MATDPQLWTPLSPHWAFVLQLRQGTSLQPEQLHGRVEHVSSGRAARFDSLAEALAFIERVLAERKAESCGR